MSQAASGGMAYAKNGEEEVGVSKPRLVVTFCEWASPGRGCPSGRWIGTIEVYRVGGGLPGWVGVCTSFLRGGPLILPASLPCSQWRRLRRRGRLLSLFSSPCKHAQHCSSAHTARGWNGGWSVVGGWRAGSLGPRVPVSFFSLAWVTTESVVPCTQREPCGRAA